MNRPSPWLFMLDPRPVIDRQTRRNTSIGGLSFALEVEGRHVAMRISERALRSHFGAKRCASTWLAAYRKNADRIDAAAIAAYQRNPSQPVFLEVGDFAAELV